MSKQLLVDTQKKSAHNQLAQERVMDAFVRSADVLVVGSLQTHLWVYRQKVQGQSIQA